MNPTLDNQWSAAATSRLGNSTTLPTMKSSSMAVIAFKLALSSASTCRSMLTNNPAITAIRDMPVQVDHPLNVLSTYMAMKLSALKMKQPSVTTGDSSGIPSPWDRFRTQLNDPVQALKVVAHWLTTLSLGMILFRP